MEHGYMLGKAHGIMPWASVTLCIISKSQKSVNKNRHITNPVLTERKTIFVSFISCNYIIPCIFFGVKIQYKRDHCKLEDKVDPEVD